jgi:MraZ protein
MLIGQYSTNLSPKRRIAIPKKIREKTGKKMIVAKWYEGCLVLIGEANWEALLNRLTGESKVITAPVRDTDRFVLGSAFELDPDNQGRVILPSSLVKYANLSKNVIFIGLGDRAEIWDKDEWEKRESFIARHAGEFIEKLAEKDEK